MLAYQAIAAILSTVFIYGTQRTPGDACSLLTQTEVNTVAGPGLQAGERQGAPSLCAWNEPPGQKSSHKRVELTLQDQQGFDLGKTPYRTKAITPVSGVGDGAYYVEMPHVPTTLSARKGSTAFVIIVKGEGWTVDQTKTMEKTLAQDVLAKL